MILLELQANFAHPLAAFAGLDLVRLLGFGSGLGTQLLVELLLANVALLLQTFDDVDGTALGYLGVDASVRVFTIAWDGRKLAESDAATTR